MAPPAAHHHGPASNSQASPWRRPWLWRHPARARRLCWPRLPARSSAWVELLCAPALARCVDVLTPHWARGWMCRTVVLVDAPLVWHNSRVRHASRSNGWKCDPVAVGVAARRLMPCLRSQQPSGLPSCLLLQVCMVHTHTNSLAPTRTRGQATPPCTRACASLQRRPGPPGGRAWV
jgi:hypothetical protein